MSLEGEGRFLRGLLGQSRVRPRVLITAQVSGRWSTTGPNLPGRSRTLKKGKDVIVPDDGTFWLCFDHEAVESWLAAVYSQETWDLEPLLRGEDLHCATARDIFGCEISHEDPRRQQAKTARYNLQYAYDYRGILDAKDLTIFGGREAALAFARSYVGSRPAMQAAKDAVFRAALETRQARSGFGRLRRLTGDERTMCKDAWSHLIQGTVSGVMNRLLLKLLAVDSEARLILNEHDGATVAFPASRDPEKTRDVCHAIASEPWTLWGHHVTLPTTWQIIRSPEWGT